MALTLTITVTEAMRTTPATVMMRKTPRTMVLTMSTEIVVAEVTETTTVKATVIRDVVSIRIAMIEAASPHATMIGAKAHPVEKAAVAVAAKVAVVAKVETEEKVVAKEQGLAKAIVETETGKTIASVVNPTEAEATGRRTPMDLAIRSMCGTNCTQMNILPLVPTHASKMTMMIAIMMMVTTMTKKMLIMKRTILHQCSRMITNRLTTKIQPTSTMWTLNNGAKSRKMPLLLRKSRLLLHQL